MDHLTDIEIYMQGAKEPTARRRWPCIPRVGEQIFLREVMGSVRVENVFWGDMMASNGEPVPDRVSVAVRCVLLEEEDHPSAEPKIVAILRDEVSSRKLGLARATLQDVKVALENIDHLRGDLNVEHKLSQESIYTLVSDTLDITEDEAADRQMETEKTVRERDEEILSLRQQLARALHGRNIHDRVEAERA
jgi:hypothetical protein